MSDQSEEQSTMQGSASPPCYPPVNVHFESLSQAAIMLASHPLIVFDAIEAGAQIDLTGQRRRELIAEWGRRRQEFPWAFSDSV